MRPQWQLLDVACAAGEAGHEVDNALAIDHIVALVEERARTLRAAHEAKG